MNHDYIVRPEFLAQAVQRLKGFAEFIGEKASQDLINEFAQEEAEQLIECWPEGCGFGSSDTTFSIRAVARDIIHSLDLQEKLELKFNPCLEISLK